MTHLTEETTTNYHPGNFLAGVLLGGLAGASAMLLLAPQSGKRTRAQIQVKGLEMRDQATEAMHDAVTQTRRQTQHLVEGVREKAQEIQHNGQEMVAEQKARLVATVDGVREKVQHNGQEMVAEQKARLNATVAAGQAAVAAARS